MSDRIERRGTDTDYIELRWIDDEHTQLDEIVAFAGGECVLHLEAMGDELYWFSLDVPGVGIHVHVGSKTLRAAVVATAEWD